MFVEYAKVGPNEMLARIGAFNRGPGTAALHLLLTRWCRSDWSWTPGHARPHSAADSAKNAFNDHGVHGRVQVLRPVLAGTKTAAHCWRVRAAGETCVNKLCRGRNSMPVANLGAAFETLFGQRIPEADGFYRRLTPFKVPGKLHNSQRPVGAADRVVHARRSVPPPGPTPLPEIPERPAREGPDPVLRLLQRRQPTAVGGFGAKVPLDTAS